jgi:hypothetical protein
MADSRDARRRSHPFRYHGPHPVRVARDELEAVQRQSAVTRGPYREQSTIEADASQTFVTPLDLIEENSSKLLLLHKLLPDSQVTQKSRDCEAMQPRRQWHMRVRSRSLPDSGIGYPFEPWRAITITLAIQMEAPRSWLRQICSGTSEQPSGDTID